MTSTFQIQTPALLVDSAVLSANLMTMAAALPGDRLRPHVKAHKTSGLARRQAEAGHAGFTCATIREVETMAAAGLGEDLLLANEILDASRLTKVIDAGARVTVAVDSPETVAAAVAAHIPEVLVDVNVGLPRCGVDPSRAGALADAAREAGLEVRGVMGYEGHVVGLEDRDERVRQAGVAMGLLGAAHAEVGGDIVSAGGTGTYDITGAMEVDGILPEIQAGSYALMDTAYAKLGLPFSHALTVLATVVSVNTGVSMNAGSSNSAGGWAVADCGLKSFGMDHGNPALAGELAGGLVWYCSDEHTVFTPPEGRPLPAVGDRVEFLPAHVDPTVAYHALMYVVTHGDDPARHDVLDAWPVDMRGW